MKVLITGGTGFIGSHLTTALVNNGHQVKVVDRRSAQHHPLPVEAQIHQLDLCITPIDHLLHDVDLVVHLASFLGIKYGIDHPWDQMSNNLLSTQRVLDACRRRNIRAVHGSSSAVYGMTSSSVPLKEADLPGFAGMLKRSGNYAMSKLIQEDLVRAFQAQFGVPVQTIRFFNCIGGGQRPTLGHVVPSFIEAALNGEPLRVHGDGTQRRTFLHISEAVAATLRVIDRGEPDGIYNVGGQEEIRIIDLARAIIALTGSRSGIEMVPKERNFCEDFEEPLARVPDLDRIGRLGFRPSMSLQQALERAVSETHIHIGAST